MTYLDAQEQIRGLLESSTYHSEWNDTLENYFPEAYWVNDIQISPYEAIIKIDWASMTFTFNKLLLEFDLQMWLPNEYGKKEYGACWASGKGKFIYSFGKIVDISDLEITLSKQSIIEPKYNYNHSKCININNVVNGLKSIYPYPDNKTLANWAEVTEETIKRWNSLKVQAKKYSVVQLMKIFYEKNIANILM